MVTLNSTVYLIIIYTFFENRGLEKWCVRLTNEKIICLEKRERSRSSFKQKGNTPPPKKKKDLDIQENTVIITHIGICKHQTNAQKVKRLFKLGNNRVSFNKIQFF